VGGAVDAEDMCAPVSGPSFFADFGRICLNPSRSPFLGDKLIADGGRAGVIWARDKRCSKVHILEAD
jgi:hypothetical protein